MTDKKDALLHIERVKGDKVLSGIEGEYKEVAEAILAAMIFSPEIKAVILTAVELYLKLHEKIGDEGLAKLEKDSHTQKILNPKKMK